MDLYKAGSYKMAFRNRIHSIFSGSYLYFILFLFSLMFTFSCKLFKPKQATKQAQFIQATINRKPAYYNIQVKGTYNKENHRINLRANDTSFLSNALVINIELGNDTTLAMLKFPRLYSANTDTFPKRQISFASLHWDNMPEETLYENYTYRYWADLQITLLSFSKDSLLQGTFSGSLLQKQKRVRVRDGKFSVYVKSK
ncbi:MAG: hypothetical protein ACXWDO_02510 [Bacteroidia bacterium]